MAPKIYNIKDPLNLERLRLAKPINKNGSHFIKTLDIDDPIYFIGPKCFSKQGFVKSGKKVFCDFVFSNEDSDFLAWLENLEESAKNEIYKNRDTWFETPLDEHDIESSMSSPYKPYKSGKFFIVRANVPTALDKVNIKVYNENESETDPENIKENTKVIAVLEFQGIRCSVRSFQFEIELKQILIVEPEKLFETCIIGKAETHKIVIPHTEDTLANSLENTKEPEPIPPYIEDNILTKAEEPDTDTFSRQEPGGFSLPLRLSNPRTPHTKCSSSPEYFAIPSELELEPEQSNIPNPPLENLEIMSSEETHEVPIEIIDDDFPLEDITDSHTEKEPPLRLKSRNDVYYKLYKEMRQRAKEAKREALASYLEAKRIKSTYLLEDLSESESDEDDLEDAEV